jgi:hypothetical protein
MVEPHRPGTSITAEQIGAAGFRQLQAMAKEAGLPRGGSADDLRERLLGWLPIATSEQVVAGGVG